LNRAAHQREEHGHQRNTRVDHLEQLVQQQDQRHDAQQRDQIRREAPAEQPFVGEDVVGGRDRVIGHHQPLADDELRNSAANDHDQIQRPCDPGVKLRREWRLDDARRSIHRACGETAR